MFCGRKYPPGFSQNSTVHGKMADATNGDAMFVAEILLELINSRMMENLTVVESDRTEEADDNDHIAKSGLQPVASPGTPQPGPSQPAPIELENTLSVPARMRKRKKLYYGDRRVPLPRKVKAQTNIKLPTPACIQEAAHEPTPEKMSRQESPNRDLTCSTTEI